MTRLIFAALMLVIVFAARDAARPAPIHIGHGPSHYCAKQGETVMRSQKADRQ